MGIQGLLPFLKKIHREVHISQFSGSTVAIDAYCWLHKGAFSCAEKLALGEKTDQYVYYCMKYVDTLLKCKVKPIMVFDGCHLKSKADVEKNRREKRELHRKKAAQLLREGRRGEAKECLQRCIDITPQMALNLMNVCRSRGVDCIVAPYEADAQLAFLNLIGLADIVITEDSDLLLFGCDKVIFKMDFNGNGVLIEQSNLNQVLDVQGGFYTFEKFRYMCILSGCDYLPSLHGIGLAKACKVFRLSRQADVSQVLKKLPTYLRMNLTVTSEYIQGFLQANNTFLHQLVFDPRKRRLCPLTPYPPDLDPEDLDYAGRYLSEGLAYEIALGNIDIHTHKKIADFDPDTDKCVRSFGQSIWDRDYKVVARRPPTQETEEKSLLGKERTVKLKVLSPSKRHRSGNDNIPKAKKAKLMGAGDAIDLLDTEPADENDKPESSRKNNPVSKSPETPTVVQAEIQDEPSDDERGEKYQRDYLPSTSWKSKPKPWYSIVEVKEEKTFTTKATSARNNVFAKTPGVTPPPRFQVNATAPVEVRSRFFSSSPKKSPQADVKPKMSSPHIGQTPKGKVCDSSQPKISCALSDQSRDMLQRQLPDLGTQLVESSNKSSDRKFVQKSPASCAVLEMFKNAKAKPKDLEQKDNTSLKQEGPSPKPKPRSAFSWSSFKVSSSQKNSPFTKPRPAKGVESEDVCNGLKATDNSSTKETPKTNVRHSLSSYFSAPSRRKISIENKRTSLTEDVRTETTEDDSCVKELVSMDYKSFLHSLSGDRTEDTEMEDPLPRSSWSADGKNCNREPESVIVDAQEAEEGALSSQNSKPDEPLRCLDKETKDVIDLTDTNDELSSYPVRKVPVVKRSDCKVPGLSRGSRGKRGQMKQTGSQQTSTLARFAFVRTTKQQENSVESSQSQGSSIDLDLDPTQEVDIVEELSRDSETSDNSDDSQYTPVSKDIDLQALARVRRGLVL